MKDLKADIGLSCRRDDASHAREMQRVEKKGRGEAL